LVDLALESLDEIEVAASPVTKTDGILAVAQKSLQFELPAHEIMASRPQREFYTTVLSKLISRVASQVFARRSIAHPGNLHAGFIHAITSGIKSALPLVPVS